METKQLDIIIPVYNAYDDLKRCLDSVLSHIEPDCRIVLIDDASTDKRIAKLFSDLEKRGLPYLSLYSNSTNQGFVKTVNRGMGLSEHDVVLLNSDTIVTRRWLEKMRRCAASSPKIGTITPFSNNAEICSFPEICRENEVTDPEELNSALEAAALPMYPDIPTAVGFCMYIRRVVIKKIGLFDEQTFGLGYGEENDFCLRAVKAGFRNVLCDDTYVAHVGNRSFDNSKQALCEENMAKLLQKHPHYMKNITAFISQDPIAPLREVAKSFLNFAGSRAVLPGVLHILHGRKGGTENHIRDLISAERGIVRHYLLITMGDNWELEDANGATVVRYQLRPYEDELWRSFFDGICAAFHINFCHLHHLSGCRGGLLEALAHSKVPYGFTVHDFYLACPTINLLDASGNFCGAETDEKNCQTCLNSQPLFEKIAIDEWRRTHQRFIEKAQFLIAPSAWVAETFKRYFPHAELKIIPHGINQSQGVGDPCSAFLVPQDGNHHIGVLGAIGPVKGARRLESLVARTKARNLPLRWIVIGYLDRQYLPHQDKDKLLTIHGHYHNKNVSALLDHYRTNLIVFPSAGPEVFSYTLSEAWAAARPVLVPPMGALAERVTETGAGWIMENWQDDDSILDQILDLLRRENQIEFEKRTQIAKNVSHVSMDDMAGATLAAYAPLIAMPRFHGPPLTKKRLYEAAKIALEGRRVNHPRNIFRSAITSMLHIALRFRYTRPGRWLYLNLPLRWQQMLKQRLLHN